jgi:hypothetical protein
MTTYITTTNGFLYPYANTVVYGSVSHEQQTINSQQQTICSQQQTIKELMEKVKKLESKLDEYVKKQSDEEDVGEPNNSNDKEEELPTFYTPEELKQSVVKKFSKINYSNNHKDGSVYVYKVIFNVLSLAETEYLCNYFGTVNTKDLGIGSWCEGDLDKCCEVFGTEHRFYMSARKLRTLAKDLLPQTEDEIVKLTTSHDMHVLESLKEIPFTVEHTATGVLLEYTKRLNRFQKEYLEDNLNKQVIDNLVNKTQFVYLSHGELYVDFANLMGYTDLEKRTKLVFKTVEPANDC